MTDKSIISVCENCVDLETIYLSKLTNLTPLSIDHLIKCENMSSFESSGCPKMMNSNSLMKLLKNCTKIESLDITECSSISEETFEIVSKNLMKITWLFLGSFNTINDKLFKSIEKIKIIHVSVLNLCCTEVTSFGVSLILNNFRYLKTIYLANCKSLHLNQEKYVSNGKKKILEGLFLSDNPFLSDDFFLKIIVDSPYLRDIVLRGNKNLSDKSLSQIVSFCPSISSLDFSNCVLLTEKTIFSLVKAIQLDTLKLGGINSITSDSLNQVLENCSNLKVLILSNCISVKNTIFNGVIASHSIEMISLTGTCCTIQSAKDLLEKKKINISLKGLK